jgi:hypothetical protein
MVEEEFEDTKEVIRICISLKSSLLSSNFVLNHPSLLMSRCRSRYEADLSVSVEVRVVRQIDGESSCGSRN